MALDLCSSICRLIIILLLLVPMMSCHQARRSSAAPTTIVHPEHNNVTDREALNSFKSTMLVGNPTGPLASWNESIHFCQWSGVTCGGRQHSERVISLDLRSHGLVGVISPYITNLTFLRKIDLSGNKIHGSIPQDIGHLLRLQHLNLSINSLHGEYGVANKVSMSGDVYSYGILLLEMFTAKRPIDDAFMGSLSAYVEKAFPEQITDVIDPHLLLHEDGRASDDTRNMNGEIAIACIASLFRIGISCSKELPTERMKMAEIIKELRMVREMILRN